MLNRVMLIGNLGKDPEFRTTESGVPRASFTLATNENYKDRNGNWQQSTEWHDIVLWKMQAERAKVLRKGMLVYVEGKLTHQKWQDREGKDYYKAEVAVEMLKILEKRESNFNANNTQGETKSSTKSTQEFSTNIEEDDLPF